MGRARLTRGVAGCASLTGSEVLQARPRQARWEIPAMFLIRLILRLLAIALVITALASLAIAIYVVLNDADLSAPAGELWAAVDRPSLDLSQAVVERYVAPVVFYPDLWFDVILPMLLWPAWKTIVVVLAGSAALGLLFWRLAGIGSGRRAT